MKRRTYLSFLILITGIVPISSSVHASTISGYIYDEITSLPITQLDLNLYDSAWTYVPIDTATGGTGTYTLYNVPAGSYFVKANPKWPHHYLAEYWDDALDRADAVLVEVGESEDVTGIDFALTAGYYIGGKVLDSETQGISTIDINVYDPDWNKMDVDAETDFGGRYYIGGLPGGDYYVMANPVYAQPFVDQYYDHSSGPIHATLVSITPPDDNIGINFDLEDGSYIEGDIRDASSQVPLNRVPIKVYNDSGQKMRLEARSNESGHYTAGAYKPGTYYVRTDPGYPDGYMDQYYSGAYDFDSATPVTVTSTKPTTGVDFYLPPGSYIRGRVTNFTENPIPEIKMYFYDTDWQLFELATSYSKEDGSFLSGAIRQGNCFVRAVAIYPQPYIDEYYNDAVERENATPVAVVLDQETQNIDFQLDEGGYILGTVLDNVTELPIPGMDLDIYGSDWSWIDYSDHTNSSGNFLIGAIPYGSYYVRCDPSAVQGHIPEYYPDAFWESDAELVTISSGSNAENIDFSLGPGGKISGRATDIDSGNPVPSVGIEVYTTSQDMLPIRIVSTKSDGTYISHGIPAGSYYVRAVAPADSGYSSEFYKDAGTFESALPVSVAISQTTNGIDFTLKYTAQPTPTPSVSLGVDLVMPQDFYHPDEVFYLTARIGNPGAPLGDLPLFVLLDVFSQYFFWPTWRMYDPPENTELDYSLIDVISGVQEIPIIHPFNWPDTGSAVVNDLKFYGAILTPDFSEVIGDMDIETFGYGPDR